MPGNRYKCRHCGEFKVFSQFTSRSLYCHICRPKVGPGVDIDRIHYKLGKVKAKPNSGMEIPRLAPGDPPDYTKKPSTRTATFSSREEGDVITDDMLKRFGYNL